MQNTLCKSNWTEWVPICWRDSRAERKSKFSTSASLEPSKTENPFSWARNAQNPSMPQGREEHTHTHLKQNRFTRGSAVAPTTPLRGLAAYRRLLQLFNKSLKPVQKIKPLKVKGHCIACYPSVINGFVGANNKQPYFNLSNQQNRKGLRSNTKRKKLSKPKGM